MRSLHVTPGTDFDMEIFAFDLISTGTICTFTTVLVGSSFGIKA